MKTIELNDTPDIPLLCFLGQNDEDIIPHFLKHYRNLGVENFYFILHGDDVSGLRKELDGEHGVQIVKSINKPFTEQLKTIELTKLSKEFEGQWVFTVDTDEFIELPFDDLGKTLETLEQFGMKGLPAYLLQRLAVDGDLKHLKKEYDVHGLFPKFDYNLCEQMGLQYPCWKLKYPLVYVTNNFEVQRGFHFSPNANSNTIEPIRAILNHFKWRGALNKSLKSYRGLDTNHNEMDEYQKYLKNNQQQVPHENSVLYSREKMLHMGLLAEPTDIQIKIYSFIQDLKKFRDDDAGTQESLKQSLNVIKEYFAKHKSDVDISLLKDLNVHDFLTETRKIAFVTPEIIGPANCGGIGTAVSALAEIFSSFGHGVDVIYYSTNTKNPARELWVKYWKARGVNLYHFECLDKYYGSHRVFSKFNWEFADFLEQQSYDLIHFDNASSVCHDVYLRKSAGAGFDKTKLVTTTHGSSRWHVEGNDLAISSFTMFIDQVHDTQLRLSDLIIHPSQYMHDLLQDRIPPNVNQLVLPNALVGEGRSFKANTEKNVKEINEIVFFGRIEERKGLFEFINLTKRILKDSVSDFQVTFIGKFGKGHSIKSILQSYDFGVENITFYTNYSSSEAINYMKSKNCMAILPSRVDNLPYTIYECLENEIPFLTTDTGGIPEMIHEDDLDAILIPSEEEDFYKRVQSILNEGIKPARLKFNPDVILLKFLSVFSLLLHRSDDQHNDFPVSQKKVPNDVLQTNVSEIVLLSGGDSSDGLISGQDVQNEFSESWNLNITEAVDKGVFNRIIDNCKSDYIIIRHDKAEYLNKNYLVGAINLLNAGFFDGLVSHYEFRRHRRKKNAFYNMIFVCPGPAEMAMSWNICGADFMILRKEAFKSVGGLDVHRDMPHLCWEIANKLYANNKKIVSAPYPLISMPQKIWHNYSYKNNEAFFGRLLKQWLVDGNQQFNNFVRILARESIDRSPYRAQMWQRLKAFERSKMELHVDKVKRKFKLR